MIYSTRQSRIESLLRKIRNSVKEIEEAVEKLEKLSAQPKIVRCGECKWWTKQKNSGQGRCELLGIYPTGGWYCANGAEERTDG